MICFQKIAERDSHNQTILTSMFQHLKDFAPNSAFDDDMTLLLLERSD